MKASELIIQLQRSIAQEDDYEVTFCVDPTVPIYCDNRPIGHVGTSLSLPSGKKTIAIFQDEAWAARAKAREQTQREHIEAELAQGKVRWHDENRQRGYLAVITVTCLGAAAYLIFFR